MGTWAEHLWTCMHGIQEGLDSHSCAKCQKIAKELGYTTEKDETYIFTSQAQVNLLKKDMLKKPKKFKPLDIKRVTFTNSKGSDMVIDINSVNLKNPPEALGVFIYTLQGHVGEENCSGADVSLEFRCIPCKKQCCEI